MLSRLFCNILAEAVDETARFYENVFGLTRSFDSDWFVLLAHPDKPDLQYGIIRRNADIVPESARSEFGGAMISFVVDDCRSRFAVALE
ncbi:MAG: hypothetical protein AAFX02_08990 [Pseudomonadota bacterium]